MRQLLVLNPNTTDSVTRQLAVAIAPLLGEGVAVTARTARFGARYIASEAAYAIAAHAALDAWACHDGAADGVLLGCFGDPGVDALRELSPAPVIGLAEAAMREAAPLGRFAIVTGGPRWRVMLERLARGLGLEASLQSIHLVARTGGELAADPAAGADLLAAACDDATRGGRVDAVILGGAALVGFAERLAARVAVPLVDNVAAGARAIGTLMAAGAARPAGPDGTAYVGLSDELQARLAGGIAGRTGS